MIVRAAYWSLGKFPVRAGQNVVTSDPLEKIARLEYSAVLEEQGIVVQMVEMVDEKGAVFARVEAGPGSRWLDTRVWRDGSWQGLFGNPGWRVRVTLRAERDLPNAHVSFMCAIAEPDTPTCPSCGFYEGQRVRLSDDFVGDRLLDPGSGVVDEWEYSDGCHIVSWEDGTTTLLPSSHVLPEEPQAP